VITTVHVAISWTDDRSPRLSDEPVEHLSIKDPRVLLGVQQELARRLGVTQAPDLVKSYPVPYFAVSLDDNPPSASMFDVRMAVTTLLEWLTAPIKINVAFAADGGWKTVLADIAVEVI
jgi:hypothetical protein